MNGRNPIHFAADYGQYEVIDYLINHGADMNVRLFIHCTRFKTGSVMVWYRLLRYIDISKNTGIF